MAESKHQNGNVRGVVLAIPTDSIRRFDGQPRINFDQKELEALIASIREIGQLNPGEVRALKKRDQENGSPKVKFVLIDGERRWRACKKLGIPFEARVREPKDNADQFAESMASNFCRVGHTSIETARGLQRLLTDGRTVEQAANICGRSVPWVYQHLALLRLDVRVQEFLEPQNGDPPRLTLSTALLLTNDIPPDDQIRLATEIVKKKMSMTAAKHFITKSTHESTGKIPGARQRLGRLFESLVTLVSNFADGSDNWLEYDGKFFDQIIGNQPRPVLEDILNHLE